MSQYCCKYPVLIYGINRKSTYLLAISQTQMGPRYSCISRFVDSITNRKIRPLEAFTGANVNRIRIGRCHNYIAYRACWLVIKNGKPGSSKVGSFPDATIVHTDIKNVWLLHYSAGSHCAAPAVGADHPPLQAIEQRNIHRLSGKRSA
jgi:hypothetical protein